MKSQFHLRSLREEKITDMLRKKPLEDLEIIREFESNLRKKRGYVIHLSKEKHLKSVMLFSGGIDSVMVSAFLLKHYKAELYPLYIKRGHTFDNFEMESASYFEQYFQKTFPGRFHYIKFINAQFPIPPFLNTDLLAKNYFYNLQFAIYAAQYAYTLEVGSGIKIRNIFIATMNTDGDDRIDHTLTALRQVMYSLCLTTRDYSWQFIPLPIEKTLGYYFSKVEFIKWAVSNSIPLELTRSSCRQNTSYHCGECLYCSIRKEAFDRAGVIDNTFYKYKEGSRLRSVIRRFLPMSGSI